MEGHSRQHERDVASAQLQLIREVRDALARAEISWWLYGGWAVDFHLAAVTREHADIEIFVWEQDAGAVRLALIAAGFAAPAALHPDEGQPFLKHGLEVGATSWHGTHSRPVERMAVACGSVRWAAGPHR